VQLSRESHKHLVGNPERGEPRLARRDEGLALVAVAIAFIAIGTAATIPPDPWDINAYPWGTQPFDTTDASYSNECGDNGVVGLDIDDDGDGFANEFDPSCIVLIDNDGNGICDGREFKELMLESGPAYPEWACSGWE